MNGLWYTIDRVGKTIAAGVRELHGLEQIVRRAPALAVDAPNRLEQPGEIGDVVRRNPKLAWIGAAISSHRCGFEPDQLRSTRREALVASPGQLAGPAVGVPSRSPPWDESPCALPTRKPPTSTACDTCRRISALLFFKLDVTRAKLFSALP